MNTTTIEQTNPATLAVAFCEELRGCLTPAQMKQIVLLNAAEAVNGYTNICHSHDFTDANEVMDAAFKKVTGASACDSGGEGIGPMSDEAVALWNAAWTMAKNADFEAGRIF
jgi:hypothetical protein